MRDVAPDRSGEPSAAAASTRSRRLRLWIGVSAFAVVAVATLGVIGVTFAAPSRAADPELFAATTPVAELEAGTPAAPVAIEPANTEPAPQASSVASAAEPEIPLPSEEFAATVLAASAEPDAPAAPVAPTPAATPAPAATATPAPPPATATPPPAVATATPQPSAPAPVVAIALSARERGLLDAMNRERVANGLPALALSAQLLPIARARSEDMVTNGYFSHYAPNGDSVYTLVSAAGLRFSAVGENLARVSGDEARSVAVAIEKLMASPPHRANILSPLFTHVAVGTVTGADGVTVFTSVFSGN